MSAKKRSRQDVNKLIVRIICIILAALMVGGVLYSLIVSLAFTSNAAAGDTYIRVGLFWGDSSQSSYTLTSGGGFLVGSLDSSSVFTPTGFLNDTTITVTCLSPSVSSSDAMAILDVYGNKRYETTSVLCIKPMSDSEYLTISGSYSYGGVFLFTRNSSVMQLVNVIELEEYIEGVMPNEISSFYPAEAKKAFAVVVRSYTLSSLKRHSSYGFNLCNTSCCQVYRGRRGVDQGFIDAVQGSAGMVMSYNNKIVQAYYSAVSGGTTCGVYETWGSSIDYLRAIATPWEDYNGASRGKWTAEYTPKELLDRLVSKGYELYGSVASVEITKFAENSTYAYYVRVTDTQGNSITINRADKIRSAFGTYSANFVVGKAGDTVPRVSYVPTDAQGGNISFDVMTDSGRATANENTLTVASSSGNNKIVPNGGLSVCTAYGSFDVAMATSPGWSSELERLVYGAKTPVTEYITLEGTPGSFVFDGRGWGHGVGMSQWGAKNLGDLGAGYMLILTTYFPGISVVNYRSIG